MDLRCFKEPCNEYRNAPFWSWNDTLLKDELIRQLDEMSDKGWGGAFMHSRVGLVTGYLSDEWMEVTRECVDKAGENKMLIWLYDEDKWPSGYAGGIIPESNEAYRNQALVLLGEQEISECDTVLKECEYNGVKMFICKRTEPLGDLKFNGTSYVDLMNPDVVRAFLESTHERYRKLFGEKFGKEIPGIFTDEPCYNMNTQYGDTPFVPWSDHLPDYFIKYKGYDIYAHIDQLFFDTGDYHKVRFDFYDAATRLFIESFSKQYYNWCDKNDLKLTGHYMAEDNLISQTRWIGAAMPHYQYMHMPGIDKLVRDIDQSVTVKQLSSSADQLGGKRTLSEVFGCIGQQSSFFERKWINDWQAALGINYVNSHLSLYSMRGERKRDYPANLFFQQPWWDDEKLFADYTARLSYAMTQGKRDVDILILHPICSVWSEYSPLHGGYNGGYELEKNYDYIIEKKFYDEPFKRLTDLLIENKLDFHYGDEMIMENHASVKSGKITVGSHEYSTVVIPEISTIRSSTLKLLEEFASCGKDDQIIFINQIPKRIDGIKTDLGMPSDVKIADSVTKAVKILEEMYDQRINITDLECDKNAKSIICQTRQTEDEKYIFLANTDNIRTVKTRISISSDKDPVLLDLMSGETSLIPFVRKSSRVIIDCTFYPAGSMLIYFSKNVKQNLNRAAAYLSTGIGFDTDQKILCECDPFNVEVKEENVLPLYNVTLRVDEKQVLTNKHVSFVWHEIFYKLPEGTLFEAEYCFDVDKIPKSELTAVIEMAENLDEILLNETQLDPLKNREDKGAFDESKSWKDINFTRVPIKDALVKGKNVLRLKGRKQNNITGPGCHRRIDDFMGHMPTEIEMVYIIGDFCIGGDASSGYFIKEPDDIVFCADITNQGYPFYAGRAVFKSSFVAKKSNKKLYLKLNDVCAASIKIFLNGEYLMTSYNKPYIIDITNNVKDGENEIEIDAATTLFNLMGPNWIESINEDIFVSPNTFIDFERFDDDLVLLPFGIGRGFLIEG